MLIQDLQKIHEHRSRLVFKHLVDEPRFAFAADGAAGQECFELRFRLKEIADQGLQGFYELIRLPLLVGGVQQSFGINARHPLGAHVGDWLEILSFGVAHAQRLFPTIFVIQPNDLKDLKDTRDNNKCSSSCVLFVFRVLLSLVGSAFQPFSALPAPCNSISASSTNLRWSSADSCRRIALAEIIVAKSAVRFHSSCSA